MLQWGTITLSYIAKFTEGISGVCVCSIMLRCYSISIVAGELPCGCYGVLGGCLLVLGGF